MNEKWDRRFLHLAEHVSWWSKDPSTLVGAVITDRHHRVVSLGFNGLPHGVDDDAAVLEQRDLKLACVIHAEENALLFARTDLRKHPHTLYVWPMPPCARCASKIIQAGIGRVVAETPGRLLLERWGQEIELAGKIFEQAGVDLEFYER